MCKWLILNVGRRTWRWLYNVSYLFSIQHLPGIQKQRDTDDCWPSAAAQTPWMHVSGEQLALPWWAAVLGTGTDDVMTGALGTCVSQCSPVHCGRHTQLWRNDDVVESLTVTHVPLLWHVHVTTSFLDSITYSRRHRLLQLNALLSVVYIITLRNVWSPQTFRVRNLTKTDLYVVGEVFIYMYHWNLVCLTSIHTPCFKKNIHSYYWL